MSISVKADILLFAVCLSGAFPPVSVATNSVYGCIIICRKPTSYISEPSASNVKVDDSTISKRLNKYSSFERVARRKALLSQKNVVARLSFTKWHLNKPQDLSVLWTVERR